MKRSFRVHANGFVRAFVVPGTACERVTLYLHGWRPNWIGPCWGSRVYGKAQGK